MATIDDELKYAKQIDEVSVVRRFFSGNEKKNVERFEKTINDIIEESGGNVARYQPPVVEENIIWSKHTTKVKIYKKTNVPYLPLKLEEQGLEPIKNIKVKVRQSRYHNAADATTALFDKANKARKALGKGNYVFLDEVELEESILGNKYHTIARIYQLPEKINFSTK